MGKKLLLLGISIAVSCLLLEGALRLVDYQPASTSPLGAFHRSDSEIGWIGIPDFEGRFKTIEFDVVVQTGSDGFRETVLRIEPSEGAEDVWVLGDSFVWGWGVENGEVVTDFLQDELGADFRVENFGINATGTVQQYLLLSRLLEARQPPAHIVMLVFHNDFDDNLDPADGARPHLRKGDSGSWEIAGVPITRKIGGFSSQLARHSRLVNLVSYFAGLTKQLRRRQDVREAVAGSGTGEPAAGRPQEPFSDERRDSMAAILTKVSELCISEGVTLRIAMVPNKHALSAKPAATATVEAICGELGISFVDLAEPGNPEHLFIEGADPHWSAAGHEQAASKIALMLSGQ